MAREVRFEWGQSGARTVDTDVAVVVDVLSFTTTLTVALDEGIDVLPFPMAKGVEDYARRHDATLAVGRRAARFGDISLSPVSVRAARGIERLVLPSPNGSAICFGLADAGVTVVGASLRNAATVARWLGERSVTVVAAGERWPDATLRPAVEDLWGAGAVLSHLSSQWLSPEAKAAVAAYAAFRPDDLLSCVSGRELTELGFAADVAAAAEIDGSTVVPVLREGVFSAPSR